MADAGTPKALIIGMDGFRPDCLSAELTPNLWAFAQAGALFPRHRARFPSETYVNLPSLVTGSPPSGHGIVQNFFVDPVIDPRRTWQGNLLADVEAAMAAHDGRFFTAPTLGELLGRAGRVLWVIGCNSPGSTRLKHPSVARFPGHLCLAIQDWRGSLPADRVTSLVESLDEPPRFNPKTPNAAAQTYAVDAFLDLVVEDGMPDVAVVWFGEPDHAFHVHGIGAAESQAIIRHVDGQVGRLIDWWRSHPEQDRINVLIASDHAHITQTERVDVTAMLGDAGFRVDSHLEDGAQLSVVPGYCGHVRVAGGDRGLAASACQALMARPEVGMLLTAPGPEMPGPGQGVPGVVPGTFSRALVGADHPRSPDIYVILRTRDEPDAHGFDGTCLFDNALAPGAGIHGGLHPKELSCLLMAQGAAFRSAWESPLPSAITDVMPTLAHILGIDAPDAWGRVLGEALAGGSADESEPETKLFVTGLDDYRQQLSVTTAAGRSYVDGGSRVEPD